MEFGNFLEIVIFVTAILTILLILVQTRGATLGAGSGSSSELYTKRRGLEKSLLTATVTTSVIFVAAIIGLLIIPG